MKIELVSVAHQGVAAEAAKPISAPSWQVVKTATGKSTDVTFAPATRGQPQQFQIRIQLKRNNQDYGKLSDIVTVTVNP